MLRIFGCDEVETTKVLEGKAQETGHYTYSPRNKGK
jgi:hypothetical protein